MAVVGAAIPRRPPPFYPEYDMIEQPDFEALLALGVFDGTRQPGVARAIQYDRAKTADGSVVRDAAVVFIEDADHRGETAVLVTAELRGGGTIRSLKAPGGRPKTTLRRTRDRETGEWGDWYSVG